MTLNCAQYADNPELLTSNLFGHVSGAYTGATQDKVGAFEAADGGLLFLDEVHRLSPEGQEKLFTYLDQGIIYRLGETKAHDWKSCALDRLSHLSIFSCASQRSTIIPERCAFVKHFF